jgi:tRNA-dihydrouridine synthase
MHSAIKLYLAPLRGFTDATFRNTYWRHFDGAFDVAVTPFVTAIKGKRVKRTHLKDIWPENNSVAPLIPQILSKDANHFITLAKAMADMGYRHINWNLGCPYSMVAKKGRGSGLLPYPEKIDAILEKVCASVPCRLSVKTRLGRFSGDEIFKLMPIFNRYPLSELLVHARTGVQMYEGSPDLERFAQVSALSDHPVVYNGDITSLSSFTLLANRFKTVNRWMIGRGVLANPFLPLVIKAREYPVDTKIAKMKRFHDALFHRYCEILYGPAHPTDRMKGFWSYFARSYKNGDRFLKKIRKVQSISQYQQMTDRFFDQEAQFME